MKHGRIAPCMRYLCLLMCIITCAGIFFCSKERGSEEVVPSFEALTLRRKIIVFNNVEAGQVSIPKKNLSKISAIGKDRQPLYSSAEIAGDFIQGKNIPITDMSGPSIRFTVPRIDPRDYCMIRAVIRLPKEIMVNGKPTREVDSQYRFDTRSSGKTEYIWFLFDASNPLFMIEGRWDLTLKSGDISVYHTYFECVKTQLNH